MLYYVISYHLILYHMILHYVMLYYIILYIHMLSEPRDGQERDQQFDHANKMTDITNKQQIKAGAKL